MFKRLGRFLCRRLCERSTWLSIASVMSGGFISFISPEVANEIASIVIAVLTTIGVMTPEGKE